MRILFITALLSVFSVSVSAQSVSGPSSDQRDQVAKLVANIVRPLVNNLPSSQKRRAREVEFHIVAAPPIQGMPFATFDQNGKRIVVISNSIVSLSLDMVILEILSDAYGKPNLTEHWLHQLLWRSFAPSQTRFGPFYDGPAPLDPFEYTGVPVDRFFKDYGVTAQGLHVSILTDILLHELAHHALDNLYNPAVAFSATMRKAEVEADDWAMQQFRTLNTIAPQLGLVDRSNSAGRILSLNMLRQIDRWARFSKAGESRSHPTVEQRLQHAIADLDCLASTEVCYFVDLIRDRWSNNPFNKSTYLERAGMGEGFASYKLGVIALSRSDNDMACKHFHDAMSANAIVDRLSLHVAWCHENGYYSGGSPTPGSLTTAKVLYSLAIREGWVAEGNGGIARIERN